MHFRVRVINGCDLIFQTFQFQAQRTGGGEQAAGGGPHGPRVHAQRDCPQPRKA
jgi:hypothetical protein